MDEIQVIHPARDAHGTVIRMAKRSRLAAGSAKIVPSPRWGSSSL
jgi:hypothetical protein